MIWRRGRRSAAARAYAKAPRVRRRTPWRRAQLIALDFEATGLDPRSDHVISYGLVPIVAGRAQVGRSVYRVVRPPVAVSPASIRVHGLRPIDLAGAPPFEDVLDDLLEALAGRALVTHFGQLEEVFLGRALAPMGLRLRQPVLDVQQLARRLDDVDGRGWEATPRRLVDLAAGLGLPAPRTHHALGDALITAQVFLALASRLERHGIGTVGELATAWPSGAWRRRR